jgi:hypothetical protein
MMAANVPALHLQALYQAHTTVLGTTRLIGQGHNLVRCYSRLLSSGIRQKYVSLHSSNQIVGFLRSVRLRMPLVRVCTFFSYLRCHDRFWSPYKMSSGEVTEGPVIVTPEASPIVLVNLFFMLTVGCCQ